MLEVLLARKPKPVPVVPSLGQVEFVAAGTYSWVVPAGVFSISAVAIGGGGAGKSGSSLYHGFGGGVNLTPPNGTLINGAAGTYVTTNSTGRYGGQGSYINATTKNILYGGGAINRGIGAVRLMWGTGRSYPNSNTADV